MRASIRTSENLFIKYLFTRDQGQQTQHTLTKEIEDTSGG